MRLPIPFEVSGRTISEVEIDAPRAGVLADTQKIAEQGKFYAALAKLVEGCLLDEEMPQTVVKAMPYRSAEYIALHAVLMISPDDGFEGVYDCPRCGTKLICELTQEDDTRDFVSDIAVGYRDEPGAVRFELEKPVTFKSKGEVIDQVENFELRYPTMGDCMKAEVRSGGATGVRLQFQVYSQALIFVNGKEINDTWKVSFGPLLFDKMTARDTIHLSREMSQYGMASDIEKSCMSCGKTWNAPVDTSGFFASALQSV
jgi:hypothetical protein